MIRCSCLVSKSRDCSYLALPMLQWSKQSCIICSTRLMLSHLLGSDSSLHCYAVIENQTSTMSWKVTLRHLHLYYVLTLNFFKHNLLTIWISQLAMFLYTVRSNILIVINFTICACEDKLNQGQECNISQPVTV